MNYELRITNFKLRDFYFLFFSLVLGVSYFVFSQIALAAPVFEIQTIEEGLTSGHIEVEVTGSVTRDTKFRFHLKNLLGADVEFTPLVYTRFADDPSGVVGDMNYTFSNLNPNTGYIVKILDYDTGASYPFTASFTTLDNGSGSGGGAGGTGGSGSSGGTSGGAGGGNPEQATNPPLASNPGTNPPLASNPETNPPLASNPGTSEIVKLENPLKNAGIDSIDGLVKKLFDIVMMIGIPVVAIFIIYSGFLFVTAQGNEEGMKKAKETFMYTMIGAAILLGAWILAQAISSTVADIGNAI